MDIRRFLEGEAIEAAPPTWSYRFQKTFRRHKKSFVVGAAFALLLIAATIFSTWQAIRAEREAEEAIRQKAAVDAINQWVTEELLVVDPFSARPGEEIRSDTTHAEALIRASGKLGGRFADQPEIEARLRFRIGHSLALLAQFEEALPHLRRAHELGKEYFGENDVRTLEIQHALAWQMAWYYGGLHQAVKDHPLDKEGMQLLQEGYDKCVEHLGPGHRLTLLFELRLAYHLSRRGHVQRAEVLLTRAAPLIEELPLDNESEMQPRFLSTRFFTKDRLRRDWKTMMSVPRSHQGRAAESRKYRKDLLHETSQRRPLSENPSMYDTDELQQMMEFSAMLIGWDRDPQEAIRLLSAGLIESRALAGNSYPTTSFLGVLADAHLALGQFEKAFEYQRESLAAFENTGVPLVLLPLQGRWVASTSARLADWKGAADELSDQRLRNIIAPESLALELLLRHLEANAHAIKIGGDAPGKAFVELNAVDARLNLNTVGCDSHANHAVRFKEKRRRDLWQLKAELAQGIGQSQSVRFRDRDPDVEIIRRSRVPMKGDCMAANHQVFNAVIVEKL